MWSWIAAFNFVIFLIGVRLRAEMRVGALRFRHVNQPPLLYVVLILDCAGGKFIHILPLSTPFQSFPTLHMHSALSRLLLQGLHTSIGMSLPLCVFKELPTTVRINVLI